MFVLTFSFPASRYHATPWGRNVNEADVAWPPDPWRVLRALIATWWRKGNREQWSEDNLACLVDALAGTLPVYNLPVGTIHAHTRHYMPQGQFDKGREKTALVFDAFVHLPQDARIVTAWPEVTLNGELLALASDLAASIGYLGRAESWVECRASDEWDGEANCSKVQSGDSGTPVRVLAPLSPAQYKAERQRLITQAEQRAARTVSSKLRRGQATSLFLSKANGANTLPERLVDALSLDTADYQDRGWVRPPAAREVLYSLSSKAASSVIPRSFARRRRTTERRGMPTVARFLLAGRPLPRIEDAVKIGELMRRAALAQFGWRIGESTQRMIPCAPWQISGRSSDGQPLKHPSHDHAFWLSEDADSDGWIDHISIYIAGGIDDQIRTKLDRITRIWLSPKQRADGDRSEPAAVKEWRLALEGFGHTTDFAGSARIFDLSKRWRSVTPFLAAGHLKATGYRGEVLRLLRRRGLLVDDGIEVDILKSITTGGTERRAIHFHRFRSRSREKQPDAAGALLRIEFLQPVAGPLAIGFGSHFGLGLFASDE